jgi:hypothetical protein
VRWGLPYAFNVIVYEMGANRGSLVWGFSLVSCLKKGMIASPPKGLGVYFRTLIGGLFHGESSTAACRL